MPWSIVSPPHIHGSLQLVSQKRTSLSILGIVLSWTGCLIALGRNFESGTIDLGLGDALVFLFTLMMAAHLVLCMDIVRRHGVLTANTAMFATCAVLVSGCTVAWGEPAPPIDLTWTIWGAVLFIGLGTAIVFLLRCRSLQSMTPATVGAYHNFIPICTIGIAHLSLGEPLTPLTVSGALAVMLGTELVRTRANPVHLLRKECLDAVEIHQGLFISCTNE
jgi:drug/metabolite transporter (DMT)-like permease